MKIVFAGTPEAAVPSLRLLSAAHDVVAVITREDAALGRKRVLTPSPVAAAASELGLSVIQANRLDAEVTARVTALEPQLGVIVAYGGLVRQPLLAAPDHGWINLHFSLLPAWRGAAPVQRAIMAGDQTSGATVFRLVPELDAGEILGGEPQPIGADETAGDLLHSLAGTGARLLARIVKEIADGSARSAPQHGDASYARKLTIDDARIDWTAGSAQVYNRIRGVTPEPGAYTLIGETRVKILEVSRAADAAPVAPGLIVRVDGRILIGTADHPIELLRIQPGGKKAMRAADWFRGLAPGAEVRAQ